MGNIINGKSQATVSFSINLNLTLGQAKALDAIVGYGPDLFVKWFYQTHGKSYLKPHEQDMRELFSVCKNELGNEISKIETAKKTINEALKLI